jgi:hypothetical protein
MNGSCWKKVSKGCQDFRISLYVDVAIVFIKPTTKDLMITNAILQSFANASGLATNLQKTQFFRIRCSQVNLVLSRIARLQIFLATI